VARSKGRTGRPYRRLCAQVWAEETHCWVCSKWVDQTLPPQHPLSRTLDHVVPLSEGGPPVDRQNARLAHRACNTARSNRRRARPRDRGLITVDPTSL
jgi:5-methylcytosine-specific restriction endonuclease McrA